MTSLSHPRLLIDIGNSYVCYTHITDSIGEHVISTRVATADFESQIHLMPKNCLWIIASVVPSLDLVIKAFYQNVVFITHDSFKSLLPIRVTYPEQVGADRLICALAASKRHGNPTLIIDSGTATTFCLVCKDGAYRGGNIFPGMGISAKSLNDYTAKIPLIYVKKTPNFVGKTTQECVQSGLYWGFLFLINGFIAKYREQYPKITVVGTGTGMATLSEGLDLDVVDLDLIFKGLSLFA